VIANDLSASAVAAMRRNVEINGLGVSQATINEISNAPGAVKADETMEPKIRINEGDAW
jgi:tRNA (guanine26-N2/guanine27-N2)-dimethyltransferase